MSEKPTLNIVLVEPRIPQNTGNVARTCACTACRLHLVGPMGFAIDDKKLKHAGLDYWHYLDINYYDGLEDFFAGTKAVLLLYHQSTSALHRHPVPGRGRTSCSGGRMPACLRHCWRPPGALHPDCPCGIPAAA